MLVSFCLPSFISFHRGIATYLVQNAVMTGSLGNLLPQAAVAADMLQTTANSIPV